MVRRAICIKNEGSLASLDLRKIYRVRTDSTAESKGMLRTVDESGEDYLRECMDYKLDPPSHRYRSMGEGVREDDEQFCAVGIPGFAGARAESGG